MDKYGYALHSKFILGGGGNAAHEADWIRTWCICTTMGDKPILFDDYNEVEVMCNAQAMPYKILRYKENGELVGLLDDYVTQYPIND